MGKIAKNWEKTVPARLKTLRRVQCGRYSQRKMDAALGLRPNTCAELESGRVKLGLGCAWIFADYYGMSIDELVGRKTPPNANYRALRRAVKEILNNDATTMRCKLDSLQRVFKTF